MATGRFRTARTVVGGFPGSLFGRIPVNGRWAVPDKRNIRQGKPFRRIVNSPMCRTGTFPALSDVIRGHTAIRVETFELLQKRESAVTTGSVSAITNVRNCVVREMGDSAEDKEIRSCLSAGSVSRGTRRCYSLPFQIDQAFSACPTSMSYPLATAAPCCRPRRRNSVRGGL